MPEEVSPMDGEQALEMTARTLEIANLIALLIDRGLITHSDGVNYFGELAGLVRGVQAATTSASVAAAADARAKYYEDCAARMQAMALPQGPSVSLVQPETGPRSIAQCAGAVVSVGSAGQSVQS